MKTARRFVAWKILRLGWIIMPEEERAAVPPLLVYAWLRPRQ